jgi:hypothetical protein
MCLRNYFGALYYLPEGSEIDIEDIPSLKSSGDLSLQTSPKDDSNFIRENGNFLFLFSSLLLFLGL